MNSPFSSLLIPRQSASSVNGDTRRSANFPPNIWGDYFLSNIFHSMDMEDNIEEKVEALKEGVRKLLITCVEKPSQQLSLIDSIQRLGIAYHFDTEINEALNHVYKNYTVVSNKSNEDLQIVALKFRLLRQQRYSISCEIFDKFTDDEGNFKESLAKDVRGMLSLYEASHVRMHGEDVLERALAFSTTNLKAAISNGSHEGSWGFGAQVRHALKWPVFKAMPRLAARNYISFYEQDPLHHPTLLSFAKLDYNTLQKLYQRELHEITRWWKDLKLVENLCFARDRCVECYTWALGTYFEPKYSLGRIMLSKIVVITSVLDDIFDLHGTFEELQLFIHAIDRWDVNCIERLPKYMKVYYEAVMDTYRGIEQDINKYDIPYAIHYTKEAMKRQARNYFFEAKWYHDGYIPTMEEYLRVGKVTSCYYLFSPISFLGMGDVASMEAFEWIESDPKSLIASGVIGRVMNDITSHKFEQERGHSASAIECYMKQYDVSEKEAVEELKKQVTNSWKEIIEDFVKSIDVPNTTFMPVLNLARLSDTFYKDEDGYTYSDGETKLIVISLLVDPVPI
ncbi:(-)-germacrene D synthase-like [Momordica charantia]|uniref:(-)-germacrene D synthase-like n=1 Tax=Momordica charantia TaxID=3673 RepID=A0A6J1DKT6_MOMCH|nr:(-)-germacrene D synthase-like [Momordica charantia]